MKAGIRMSNGKDAMRPTNCLHLAVWLVSFRTPKRKYMLHTCQAFLPFDTETLKTLTRSLDIVDRDG